MNKMPPQEARKLWIDALRSGEYQQTTGTLYDGEGYCCLGVAVKVLAPIADEELRGSTLALYPEVRCALGLLDRQGTYNSQTRSLASDNDGGKTFAEIADIIESEPEGLFE